MKDPLMLPRMVRMVNTMLHSINSYSRFLCVLYPTGLFFEVTSTFTHLITFSVMCLLHTQVKAMVVVVVVLRVVVQVVSVRLRQQVVHTLDQVAAEEYKLVVELVVHRLSLEVAEDHKLVLELGVVVLVMVVEVCKLEQALEVAVAEAAVVLVLVVEGRKLEQVWGVEVAAAAAAVVVLVVVVEDCKLELAVGVVVVVVVVAAAQVAVRILFSVDRTVVSRQVAHIVT